jgi:hypothetical protein
VAKTIKPDTELLTALIKSAMCMSASSVEFAPVLTPTSDGEIQDERMPDVFLGREDDVANDYESGTENGKQTASQIQGRLEIVNREGGHIDGL